MVRGRYLQNREKLAWTSLDMKAGMSRRTCNLIKLKPDGEWRRTVSITRR